MLCVFAEQAGERASDHQGHAAEGQTDGGQPVHAGLRQGMCVLHSGQSRLGRQHRGVVRLCVLHGRQLRSAGQYGRVGGLILNDVVAAVTAVITAIIVRGLRRDDNDRLGFGDGGVVVADMSLSGSRLGLGDSGNPQSFRIGGLVVVTDIFALTLIV